MTKKTVSLWVFRLEVASDKTVWTKDIKAELQKLLYGSDLIGNWYVEEMFSEDAIHIQEKKKEKP